MCQIGCSTWNSGVVDASTVTRRYRNTSDKGVFVTYNVRDLVGGAVGMEGSTWNSLGRLEAVRGGRLSGRGVVHASGIGMFHVEQYVQPREVTMHPWGTEELRSSRRPLTKGVCPRRFPACAQRETKSGNGGRRRPKSGRPQKCEQVQQPCVRRRATTGKGRAGSPEKVRCSTWNNDAAVMGPAARHTFAPQTVGSTGRPDRTSPDWSSPCGHSVSVSRDAGSRDRFGAQVTRGTDQ